MIKPLRNIIEDVSDDTKLTKGKPAWYKQDGVYEKIKEMDEKGEGENIAQHFSVSKNEVAKAFRHYHEKYGYKRSPKGFAHPVKQEHIKSLDANGATIDDIATKIGSSKDVVKSYLKKMKDKGVPLTKRTKGGTKRALSSWKFWTDDKVAELDKHLANPSMSREEIAKKMNTSLGVIKAATHKDNKNVRPRLTNVNVKRENIKGPKWLTPEKKKALIRMDQDGVPHAEMATALGRSEKHDIRNALTQMKKHEGYKPFDRSGNVKMNRKKLFRTRKP